MTELVFIDTETGGLDPTTDALLEVGLVHWRDGQVLDVLEVAIQSSGLVVQPAALAVNKIDIEEHDWLAHSRDVAGKAIASWIVDRWPRGKARPAGHNVGFDIGFMRALLGGQFSDLSFSHRLVDTCSILAFCCDAGLVPLQKHSLDVACEHFGIQRARAHRALDDALAAAELYGRLLGLVNPALCGRTDETAESGRIPTGRLVTHG